MQAIQKGIKVNEKYNDAERYSKKIEGISRTTNWFETKTKYEGARRLIDEQKKANDELQFGRRELMVRRATRLQQLYQKEYEEWESRLRQQGLSIYKNKV